MNARIKHKIFVQWSRNPRRAYARHGIGRILKATNGFCIYQFPGNGYIYHTCINGRIVKIKDELLTPCGFYK